MKTGALVRTRDTKGSRDCRLPTGFGIVTDGLDGLVATSSRLKVVYVAWVDDTYGKPRPVNTCYLELICK